MSPCHLFNLPIELREQIYSRTLSCSDSHNFCVWNGVLLTLVDGRIYKPFTHKPWNSGASTRCGSSGLALLQACKQIRQEAMPVFHENLELRLHVDGRYRSPTEIKGLDLGPVEEVGFLRGVKYWDVTVRLSNVEDAPRLIAQLESLEMITSGKRNVEWRCISVQISRYADDEDPEGGRRVLDAVKAMTGIDELEEIRDPWREGTTIYDYQKDRLRWRTWT